jgi:LmbE family N-acetylglucosaminyl deacetylase
VSVTDTYAGTPESAWTAWERLGELPELALDDCPAALIVAPHPDDEVLGAGGTLAELHARGVDVSCVALTDGEASHPLAPVAPEALGRRRAAETKRAVELLLGRSKITRARFPDGGLARCESRIEREIERRLAPGTWCFAPFLHDGHPDHEACARAAARACSRRGGRLIEYPIWMWHWTVPGAPGVPWQRARRISLPHATRARKARAIAMFTSQVAPICDGPGGAAILPPDVLEHFLRSFEVVFA